MNYQYRYGTTTSEAIRILYADGGLTRYYHGLVAALIQGSVVRFGDTAANIGILTLLQTVIYLKDLPTLVKTMFASIAAAGFRAIFTPVDTIKTLMQTRGSKGLPVLQHRVSVGEKEKNVFGSLMRLRLNNTESGLCGMVPWPLPLADSLDTILYVHTTCYHLQIAYLTIQWFGTYNYLESSLPQAHTLVEELLRHALIGFVASAVSDSVSNSLRVVKTYCQVNETRIDYLDAVREVIATDGVKGLLGRGLKTRILANGVQGLIFSVLWKFFQDV
ncbi:hypothetical protein C0992_002873 [Termitomyces sp. T32_za158]|nr:hypothetical protein C0992_002873 [Termitomyces sp. T32_za158]